MALTLGEEERSLETQFGKTGGIVGSPLLRKESNFKNFVCGNYTGGRGRRGVPLSVAENRKENKKGRKRIVETSVQKFREEF